MKARQAFLLSCILGILLRFVVKRPFYECITLFIAGFLGLGGLWPSYYAIKTLPRDWRFLKTLLRAFKVGKSLQAKGGTIPLMFAKHVSSHPNKPAILFEEQTWSFKDIDEYSNKVANLFKSLGLQVGDNVALYMQNRPEYTCVFIGLTKIGVRIPCINYNLTEQSLLHCINTVGARAIVYEECLEAGISSIYNELDDEVKGMLFCIKSDDSKCIGRDFESELEDNSPLPLVDVQPDDNCCYIYTSGTTGLPKAVPIRHIRLALLPIVFGDFAKFNSSDIIYVSLPLYHTNGGSIGMGQMIVNGYTVALRRKFSARYFWKDCIKYKCTAVLYIGEVCRYVLSVPPDESTDKGHCVRVALGNGLRPDIWREFKTRYNIPTILEFYGATEGNTAVMNTTNKEGSVGFDFKLFGFLVQRYLVQADPTTGEVVRNAKGYCQEVPVGSPGLLIGLIKQKDLFSRFDGYTNKTATNKKILTDVFKKGDMYFNTGDMLYQDEEGYFYFSDRVGDTFRWKGENVSSTEVENIISTLLPTASPDVVVVFGVEIPKSDGRAGMAVIPSHVACDINITQFADQLRPRLPSYALPLFIRYVESVDLTGTFKLQKTRYRKEGYDPSATGGDQVFVYDKGQQAYVPFSEEKYQMMQDGTLQI